MVARNSPVVAQPTHVACPDCGVESPYDPHVHRVRCPNCKTYYFPSLEIVRPPVLADWYKEDYSPPPLSWQSLSPNIRGILMLGGIVLVEWIVSALFSSR
jgi:hypothetical protein